MTEIALGMICTRCFLITKYAIPLREPDVSFEVPQNPATRSQRMYLSYKVPIVLTSFTTPATQVNTKAITPDTHQPELFHCLHTMLADSPMSEQSHRKSLYQNKGTVKFTCTC